LKAIHYSARPFVDIRALLLQRVDEVLGIEPCGRGWTCP